MLLCTLCLDESFRNYAKPRLHGGRLDELRVAGTTFFMNLREIQGINPDDKAMEAFTNRFGHILRAMKDLDH